MTKQQDNERRLDDLELQMEALMEQHTRTDRTLLQIHGARCRWSLCRARTYMGNHRIKHLYPDPLASC